MLLTKCESLSSEHDLIQSTNVIYRLLGLSVEVEVLHVGVKKREIYNSWGISKTSCKMVRLK